MRYQVTYRLLHPEYLPTTSVTIMHAYSHAELDAGLVRLLTKWRARGYTVQIVKVVQGKSTKAKRHTRKA
jgi:hypothetical protein